MKYWLYSEGNILGPYAPAELLSMPAFGHGSLVCSETAGGGNPGDWRPAEEVGEIAEALSVGVGTVSVGQYGGARDAYDPSPAAEAYYRAGTAPEEGYGELLDTIDNILGAYKEGGTAADETLPPDLDLAQNFDVRLSKVQEELEAARWEKNLLLEKIRSRDIEERSSKARIAELEKKLEAALKNAELQEVKAAEARAEAERLAAARAEAERLASELKERHAPYKSAAAPVQEAPAENSRESAPGPVRKLRPAEDERGAGPAAKDKPRPVIRPLWSAGRKPAQDAEHAPVPPAEKPAPVRPLSVQAPDTGVPAGDKGKAADQGPGAFPVPDPSKVSAAHFNAKEPVPPPAAPPPPEAPSPFREKEPSPAPAAPKPSAPFQDKGPVPVQPVQPAPAAAPAPEPSGADTSEGADPVYYRPSSAKASVPPQPGSVQSKIEPAHGAEPPRSAGSAPEIPVILPPQPQSPSAWNNVSAAQQSAPAKMQAPEGWFSGQTASIKPQPAGTVPLPRPSGDEAAALKESVLSGRQTERVTIPVQTLKEAPKKSAAQKPKTRRKTAFIATLIVFACIAAFGLGLFFFSGGSLAEFSLLTLGGKDAASADIQPETEAPPAETQAAQPAFGSATNENIRRAIDIVKAYRLSGGRGTMEAWFANSFLSGSAAGSNEEWSATMLHESNFVVQYKLLRPRQEPLIYQFEVDVTAGSITRGINNNAIELMESNAAPPPPPPAPVKPAVRKKAVKKSRALPVLPLPDPEPVKIRVGDSVPTGFETAELDDSDKVKYLIAQESDEELF